MSLPSNPHTPLDALCQSCLLPVLLLAAMGRIFQLDVSSLWADELWGVEYCSRGWLAMIDNLINKDSHPPGYQSLLCGWMNLFGGSDFSVRLPSVIAGVLAVWALFHFAHLFFSPFVAILSATLLAASYNGIYYSQEARAYVFILLFSICYLQAFLQIFLLKQTLFQQRNWSLFLQLWLAGLLLMYFHYVGVVIVCGSVLLLPWLVTVSRRHLFECFLLFLPFLLLYLPWLPVMYKHFMYPDASFLTPLPDSKELLETAKFLYGPESYRYYFGSLVLAGFILWMIVNARRKQLALTHKIGVLMLFFCLIPVVIFFMESHIGNSAYTIRHFVYIIPFFCVIQSMCVEALLGFARIRIDNTSVLLIVGAVFVASMSLNTATNLKYGGKLYTEVAKIEYRNAVKIILRDPEFLAGPRHIFASDLFFDHYIKSWGLRDGAEKQWHWDIPEKITEYADYIQKNAVSEFYYLEIFRDPAHPRPSPLLEKLLERYDAVCATPLVWTHTVKFSTRPPMHRPTAMPRCPRSTPE